MKHPMKLMMAGMVMFLATSSFSGSADASPARNTFSFVTSSSPADLSGPRIDRKKDKRDRRETKRQLVEKRREARRDHAVKAASGKK